MPREEKYVNRAFGQVVESGANTLTFSQINTGISLFSKLAWLIHRLMWHSSARDEMTASSDYMQMALTVSNKMVGLNLNDPAVVNLWEQHVVLNGAAATMTHYTSPHAISFTDLPGKGLLIPATPLFIAAEGVSLTNAQTISVLIFYTMVELKTEDYWELVEATRMVE